jgi:hypothetical protein
MIRDPSDGSVAGKKRPSMKVLKARHGDSWGINPPPDMPKKLPAQAPTAEQLRQHYAKHSLAFAPKSTPETAIADGESE